MTTTIILPTKNEEGAISQTICEIRAVCDNKILVVDGHSTDDTTFLASQFSNVDVIYDNGKGKGAALRIAFEHCAPDDVVFVDADGTYDVHRIPEFISALDNGYDVVTALFRFENGAEPAILGLKLWTIGIHVWKVPFLLFYGKWITNNLSGFRALSRYAIEVMDLEENDFGIETEITIKTIRSNLKHLNIDTIYHKRTLGKSKLDKRCPIINIPNLFTKQWREIYWALFKYRFWRKK